MCEMIGMRWKSAVWRNLGQARLQPGGRIILLRNVWLSGTRVPTMLTREQLYSSQRKKPARKETAGTTFLGRSVAADGQLIVRLLFSIEGFDFKRAATGIRAHNGNGQG